MLNWLPWRIAVKYIARSHGFLDPVHLLARLRQFSQPSEVDEPIELLRAGVVFHARGLLNSKVIQHNLDWVWPYWIERQYDPRDVSYLPRAFSITQINLTNRNWSSVGIPGHSELPIVDPRGLLTPLWDGWSLDVWLISDSGIRLLPSKQLHCQQHQTDEQGLCVQTQTQTEGVTLNNRVWMECNEGLISCVMSCVAEIPEGGWLIISARPYNPEGISLIDDLTLDQQRSIWTINNKSTVQFDHPVERHHTSDYSNGDVLIHLLDKEQTSSRHCKVGMVTAAAMFRVSGSSTTQVNVRIAFENTQQKIDQIDHADAWIQALKGKSELRSPDNNWNKLYESAVRTLILCTPDDVYAGPYTYKRYWYRDTVFIAHGLLCAGLVHRVEHIIEQFPKRQNKQGYFHSQDGEWDSNGQVLWLINQYYLKTRQLPSESIWSSVQIGAEWIIKKRLPDNVNEPWQGLMPAGFSAEHLGPNDYYYWDDFWSISGLESAANLASALGYLDIAKHYRLEAIDFRRAVDASLHRWSAQHKMTAIPASPMRRMDAGAIGSVVAGYPLQLYSPGCSELSGTLDFLLKNCLYKDGFFQDMIHSGVNIYLTLHIAQNLLRKNEPRFADLIQSVVTHASVAGHWPDAVHPHTNGGCMGDGQHAWAAAEWIAMVRNCFIREDNGELILLSGIPLQWLYQNAEVGFGPVPTEFGTVLVSIQSDIEDNAYCHLKIDANWRGAVPTIRVCLPNTASVSLANGESSLRIKKPAC